MRGSVENHRPAGWWFFASCRARSLLQHAAQSLQLTAVSLGNGAVRLQGDVPGEDAILGENQLGVAGHQFVGEAGLALAPGPFYKTSAKIEAII